MTDYRTSAVYDPFTLDASYADRQKIVIVPDEVIEAERSAHKQLDLLDDDRGYPIDELVTKIAEFVVTPAAVYIVQVVVKAALELRKRGVPVWTVGRSEVSDLRFPPGHPQDNVLYVGNPAAARLYYPAAEFHRSVFEEKFSEALELVMALGATELRAYRIEGYGSEIAANAELAAGPVKAFKGKFEKTAKQRSTMVFEGAFPGSSKPRVPDDLSWFETERTWQTLAKARVQHGAKQFSLIVGYQEDFGINGKLKGMVEGVGLGIGGKFEEQQDTIWRIDAEFPAAVPTASEPRS